MLFCFIFYFRGLKFYEFMNNLGRFSTSKKPSSLLNIFVTWSRALSLGEIFGEVIKPGLDSD